MTAIQEYTEKILLFSTGAAQEAIASRLADEFGATLDEINELPPLVNRVLAAAIQAQTAETQQTQATLAMQTSLQIVKGHLSKLRTTLNNNLKRTHPLFKQLGLTASPPSRQAAFIGYAEQTLLTGANLAPDDAALLIKYKWDPARFTAALTDVATLRTVNQTQEQAKGDYTAAMTDLYAQIDQLDELFRPLAKNARSACRDDPAALERLGLKSSIPQKPRRPLPAQARKSAAKTKTDQTGSPLVV